MKLRILLIFVFVILAIATFAIYTTFYSGRTKAFSCTEGTYCTVNSECSGGTCDLSTYKCNCSNIPNTNRIVGDPTDPPTKVPTRSPTKSPTRSPTRSPTPRPSGYYPTSTPKPSGYYPTSTPKPSGAYPTPTPGYTSYPTPTHRPSPSPTPKWI